MALMSSVEGGGAGGFSCPKLRACQASGPKEERRALDTDEQARWSRVFQVCCYEGSDLWSSSAWIVDIVAMVEVGGVGWSGRKERNGGMFVIAFLLTAHMRALSQLLRLILGSATIVYCLSAHNYYFLCSLPALQPSLLHIFINHCFLYLSIS
jgi:hypothetical protein